MTAGRQFALVCLGVVGVGLAIAFSTGKKTEAPVAPAPTVKPEDVPPAPAPEVPTTSPEGCVTPTPVASPLCRFRSGPSLPVPLAAGAATVSGSYLYVVGGALTINGTQGATSVYYAPLSATGDIGAWKTTTPYPKPIIHEGAVASDGVLYVLGGAIPTDTDNLVQSDVYFAKTKPDGSLGEWTKGPELPEPVGAGGYAVLNNFLYVFGGYSSTGPGTTSTGSVYFSAINPKGGLGPWQKTTSLTGGRFFFASAAGQGALYAIGGTYKNGGQHGPFSDGPTQCEPSRVLIGRQQPNGTISGWTSGTPFSDNSLAAGAAIVGQTLFVVQGRGNRQLHGSAELLSTPLAPDGSIGAWTVVGQLPEIAASRAVAVGPSAIYAVGGTAVIDGAAVLLPISDVIPFKNGALACQ